MQIRSKLFTKPLGAVESHKVIPDKAFNEMMGACRATRDML